MKNLKKLKEYVRERATEKSSAALFRYNNFLFIKKMKGIAKYTENETWQGKVTWAEKNKSQYFRSALEMLKLMDKALTEEDFPDEEEEE